MPPKQSKASKKGAHGKVSPIIYLLIRQSQQKEEEEEEEDRRCINTHRLAPSTQCHRFQNKSIHKYKST